MNIVVVKCYARVFGAKRRPHTPDILLLEACSRLFLEVSVRAHALSIITKFALLFKIGLIVLAE